MTRTDDLSELKRKAEAATPGPWAWMGQGQHNIALATTHSGRRYVMGFSRYGLREAQPTFQTAGRMVPASALLKFEVGDGKATGIKEARADGTVYRYDIAGIDHPDATYIAAASPSAILSLIARLEAAEARVKELEGELAKPTRVVVRKVPAPQISFED